MQISASKLVKDTLIKTPFPGGIVAPVREKPKMVVPLADIINPLSSAEPPDAPVIVTPARSNWNPATGSLLFITISSVPASISTFSIDRSTAHTLATHTIKDTKYFLNMMFSLHIIF